MDKPMSFQSYGGGSSPPSAAKYLKARPAPSCPAIAPLPSLFHGTSSTIAKAIVAEGYFRPGATVPIANPKYVYLIGGIVSAIMFGYNRVMGKFVDGKWTQQHFISGMKYPSITVFEIPPATLDASLLRTSDLFRGETLYEGTIPVKNVIGCVELPVTRRLVKVVWALFNGGLSNYVGMDLTKHLYGRALEADWEGV